MSVLLSLYFQLTNRFVRAVSWPALTGSASTETYSVMYSKFCFFVKIYWKCFSYLSLRVRQTAPMGLMSRGVTPSMTRMLPTDVMPITALFPIASAVTMEHKYLGVWNPKRRHNWLFWLSMTPSITRIGRSIRRYSHPIGPMPTAVPFKPHFSWATNTPTTDTSRNCGTMDTK